MTSKRTALVLSLLALAAAGCGGDDNSGDYGPVPTVPLTVPGGDSTIGDAGVDTTVETVPTTPTPAPSPAPTPTPTPTPQTPDTPQNDTPPPAGSEAQQFENFCADNPGAC